MKTILLVFASVAVAAAGPLYSVTDLGGLGGSSAVAFSINSSGVAVGWATTPFADQYAFSSNGGALHDLYSGAAYGINASGAIAGTLYKDGQARGEIWSASGNIDLGAGVFVTGINDPGAVIGGNGHAFVWINGAYRDLGALPGGDWSSAYGINNSGVVVGYGTTGNGTFRGFVWNAAGGMTELGTLGGANSYAMGVNNNGEVVGHSANAAGYDHAFAAFGAFMQDLGTLGGTGSYAYGVNDSGVAVGYSWLATGDNPHAFATIGGVMTDLNSLISPGSGWQLLEAYGINDNGQIVGEGLLNGQARAFRLDLVESPSNPAASPTPEPATWMLLLLTSVFGAMWRTHSCLRPRFSCKNKP